MADQSKQVCMRTSNDKRQLTAIRTRATFECLLGKLAEKASHIPEQHHVTQDSPVIIIMEPFASTAKKPSLPSKGICINARTTLHSTYIFEQRDTHTSKIRQTG